MLTHNTHYPTIEDRGEIVGYAIRDIVTGKYFTKSSAWSKYKSNSFICPDRKTAKDVFFERRFVVEPVFKSDLV